MKGKLIVIEGIDGSGKGTQAKLLFSRLKKEGYKVRYVNFPNYDSWSSIFVKKYLNKELGSLDELTPEQCSIFYALDRYVASNELNRWLEDGYIIISNRYVAANKGHQASKIEDKSKRSKFLEWLNELEYEILKNPREDFNIFLDITPEIAQKLVDQKTLRKYLDKDKKRDLHEENLDYLRNARDTYLEIAESEDNWLKVESVESGELLTIKAIHNKIWKLIEEGILEAN